MKFATGTSKSASELINLRACGFGSDKAVLGEEAAGGRRAGPSGFAAEILAMLQKLTGLRGSPRWSGCRKSPSLRPRQRRHLGDVARNWQVHFSPGPEFLLNGSDPLRLLSELKQLGTLQIKASVAAVPPLSDLDPERCYIHWDMLLSTSASVEAIRDVFIFVEDRCELAMGCAGF